MKVKLESTIGVLMPTQLSLLDLYRQSDLVAIAQIGRSTVIETEDGAKQIKTDLHISSHFKGDSNQQVFPGVSHPTNEKFREPNAFSFDCEALKHLPFRTYSDSHMIL